MELTWGSVPKEPGGGVSSLQPDSFKLLPLGLSGPAQSLPKVGQSGVWGWRGSWRGGEKGREALASGERALWCRTGWETGGEFLAPQSRTREGP